MSAARRHRHPGHRLVAYRRGLSRRDKGVDSNSGSPTAGLHLVHAGRARGGAAGCSCVRGATSVGAGDVRVRRRGPHPPASLYRSYLAQSDVFVGIYWQRYGWVAPDMEISGLEDEMILSSGMPQLVYLKRPAPNMEPPLRKMLSRLEGEDSVSYRPFTTADELHGLLLDDLAVLLTERFDQANETPTSSPRPHHLLPAQTSTFIGRDEELREVAELLADDGVRLVTLTGAGGSGKTRLAIRDRNRRRRTLCRWRLLRRPQCRTRGSRRLCRGRPSRWGDRRR